MAIIGGWRLKYKKPPKKKPHAKKYRAYSERNGQLSGLGYAGYAEYLQSDDWRRVREQKLRRFPHCLLCKKQACQVHHTSYAPEVLLGLVPQLLVTLCRDCHEGIEFDGERKRTLPEANCELRRRAAQAGEQRWLRMLKRTGERKSRRKLHGPHGLYAAANKTEQARSRNT